MRFESDSEKVGSLLDELNHPVRLIQQQLGEEVFFAEFR
jgi:hypothetical protein